MTDERPLNIRPAKRAPEPNMIRQIFMMFGSEVSSSPEATQASGILHLRNWKETQTTETDLEYRVEAEFMPQLDMFCPDCQSERVYRHGWRDQDIPDRPVHGKRVIIALHRGRFKCRDCGRTFLQSLEDVSFSHIMTWRLEQYILRQAFKATFQSVAQETGVSEGLVRRIFHEHVRQRERWRQVETPVWLGIDEVSVSRQLRAIFTDVKERKPIELLQDPRKSSVAAFLRTLDAERVQVVTMDMSKHYRDAVRQVLPKAQIVVDHFHVVKLANQMVEQVRRRTQTELTAKQRRDLKRDRFIFLRRSADLNVEERVSRDKWFASYPQLGAAYAAKERFCDIWKCDSRAMAEAEYAQWLEWIEGKGMKEAFSDLIRAMTNWNAEIFAYVDHRVTNAYTEALNGIVKQTQRSGRGYSFGVLRGRLLYQPPESPPTEMWVELPSTFLATGHYFSDDENELG